MILSMNFTSMEESSAFSDEDADLLASTRLPAWIVAALKEAGFSRLSEISSMTDEQILSLRGIGRRALALIKAELVGASRPTQTAPKH